MKEQISVVGPTYSTYPKLTVDCVLRDKRQKVGSELIHCFGSLPGWHSDTVFRVVKLLLLLLLLLLLEKTNLSCR